MPEAVTLWAVPASHPCKAVEKALELKGVPVKRLDLVPIMHRAVMRVRFGDTSVPGVVFADGERVQGSRPIIAAIEARWPQPPLWPADRDRRAEVARADEWGEQVLQPIARRLTWWVLGERPDAVPGYAGDARLLPPSPAFASRALAPYVARGSRHFNGVDEPTVRADLTHLPAHLDRVDAWLAEGVLGGETLNAADLQLAASLRLLLTLEDVRPVLDARPCGPYARRVFSDWPGSGPSGAVPPSWLPAG